MTTKEEIYYDEEDEEILENLRKHKKRQTLQSTLCKKKFNTKELEQIMTGEELDDTN